MVRRAGQYNYAVDSTYDEIDMRLEDTNAVFLSMNEITRIYYYKFENQDKRKAKERIRDLFVVGCLTALRYSDYSALTKDNLQNGYIVKRTKKTNVDVKVPAHDYVKEIFAKYGGNIPSGLCIQYFNKYLKVIMQEIGLNDKITYSFTKGGKLQTVTREKWELISSHTARRSAATNMYLTGRMKTLEIMKLTGHRSEHNFFRYIRLTGEDTARSISGDMFSESKISQFNIHNFTKMYIFAIVSILQYIYGVKRTKIRELYIVSQGSYICRNKCSSRSNM